MVRFFKTRTFQGKKIFREENYKTVGRDNGEWLAQFSFARTDFNRQVSLYLSSFQKCLRETVITFTPKNHRACRYRTCDRMHTSSETLCFYYRRDYYTFLKYQRSTISLLNSRHMFKDLFFWIKQIRKMKTCRYFSILCQFIR